MAVMVCPHTGLATQLSQVLIISRVALGILVCNAFNLIFYLSPRPIISLRLILASPMVPALMLIVSLYFVPESPRFYLRPHRGNYNPEEAYRCLRRLRNTEVGFFWCVTLLSFLTVVSLAPSTARPLLGTSKCVIRRRRHGTRERDLP